MSKRQLVPLWCARSKPRFGCGWWDSTHLQHSVGSILARPIDADTHSLTTARAHLSQDAIPSIPIFTFTWRPTQLPARISKARQPEPPPAETKMENGGQSEGKDPSSFLGDIIGNPVTVKLNSGVVYKGMHPRRSFLRHSHLARF